MYIHIISIMHIYIFFLDFHYLVNWQGSCSSVKLRKLRLIRLNGNCGGYKLAKG